MPSEEELQKQLSQIVRSGVDRGVEHAERAARLWSELSLDPEHLRWQRVRSLWKESGGEELLAQYQALDRAQGDDRRIHGSDFEATDARCVQSKETTRTVSTIRGSCLYMGAGGASIRSFSTCVYV